MTKKNLRPQQVAPVQRETTGTSSQQGQMTASLNFNKLLGKQGADALKNVVLATPYGQIAKAAKLIR
jgi:prenylated cyclic peptide (anacyclamide/piricyclamide family)